HCEFMQYAVQYRTLKTTKATGQTILHVVSTIDTASRLWEQLMLDEQGGEASSVSFSLLDPVSSYPSIDPFC
ncbi:hypothetical protein PENTCL1PPCAC_7734, partial [Pristionchus entomophagus]